jgi:type IV secretory pathway VirB6-like protein
MGSIYFTHFPITYYKFECFILSNPSNSSKLETKLFMNEINDQDSYVVISKSPNYNLKMILINYFPQPNKKIFKWKFYGMWN